MTMTTGEKWSRLWNCDEAQDIAEYAVLIAIVLIIVTVTATALGANAHTLWTKVSDAFGKVAK
jgi:Flp pilus assembly pilin Flp